MTGQLKIKKKKKTSFDGELGESVIETEGINKDNLQERVLFEEYVFPFTSTSAFALLPAPRVFSSTNVIRRLFFFCCCWNSYFELDGICWQHVAKPVFATQHH